MASLCQDAIGGLMTATSAEEVCVAVDRRQTRENARERFDQMIRDAVLPRHVGYFPPEVSIIHLDSQTSAGLQAADIIAGTVFRSLEKRDGSYLAIIESKIVYSNIR